MTPRSRRRLDGRGPVLATDLRTVTDVDVLIDRGVAVIGTTVHRVGDAVLRVPEDDSRRPDPLELFAERIADNRHPDAQAPVVAHDERADR